MKTLKVFGYELVISLSSNKASNDSYEVPLVVSIIVSAALLYTQFG